MDFEWLRLTFLALLQGFTEFLPISSSAHLILPKEVLGWPDQGLEFDVAVHIGSLSAVCFFFRTEIIALIRGWFSWLGGNRQDPHGKLSWFIIIATIPAGLAGLFFDDLIEQYSRSMLLIAFTSIVFAILLFFADRQKAVKDSLSSMSAGSALLIGLAQMMALIPGTSRSGVTMTAALFCGFDRKTSARFSFLMAIPIIAASGLLKGAEMITVAEPTAWAILAYGALVSAVMSFACIHYFMRLIDRLGFMPFIVYRIALGIALLVLYFLLSMA
ncbi:MAG: undecaprenyl-diphosphate phosphatase [Pseudohongiellaceae bacterium]|nr:undecaprenyl-diphosphate phosphatase [Pseudohongiellaceae bacterium]